MLKIENEYFAIGKSIRKIEDIKHILNKIDIDNEFETDKINLVNQLEVIIKQDTQKEDSLFLKLENLREEARLKKNIYSDPRSILKKCYLETGLEEIAEFCKIKDINIEFEDFYDSLIGMVVDEQVDSKTIYKGEKIKIHGDVWTGISEMGSYLIIAKNPRDCNHWYIDLIND